MVEMKHTPGPWQAEITKMTDGRPFGSVSAGVGVDVTYLTLRSPREVVANTHLIAAAPDMLAALRAHHAWSYCERQGLGSFDARSTLCAHSDYLTAKALAAVEGKDFDAEYKGSRRLIVWPQVRLEESDFAQAEALIEEALAHERATLSAGELT